MFYSSEFSDVSTYSGVMQKSEKQKDCLLSHRVWGNKKEGIAG